MKLVLPLVMLLAVGARAELPPYVYLEMQEKAAEFLKIEVLSSKQQPVAKGSSLTPFDLKGDTKVFRITLSAKILDVERSDSDLKKGDVISISYLRTERPAASGWVGPSEIPLLKKSDVTDAYLSKDAESNTYSPAARGRSFQTLQE